MLVGLLHTRAGDDEIEHGGDAALVCGERPDDRVIHGRRIGNLLAVAAARFGDPGEVGLEAKSVSMMRLFTPNSWISRIEPSARSLSTHQVRLIELPRAKKFH